MKKLFFISIFSILLGVLNVNAMTESELRARFAETITIGNSKYSLPSGTLKQVDDYLAKYELTSDECDYISAKIDEAIKILESEGKENFKDMSESTKTKLKNLVANVASNTSVKATVTDGAVIILNDDGSTFAEVSKLIKQTDVSSNNITMIVGMSAVIMLIGAGLVIRQVKNNA